MIATIAVLAAKTKKTAAIIWKALFSDRSDNDPWD